MPQDSRNARLGCRLGSSNRPLDYYKIEAPNRRHRESTTATVLVPWKTVEAVIQVQSFSQDLWMAWHRSMTDDGMVEVARTMTDQQGKRGQGRARLEGERKRDGLAQCRSVRTRRGVAFHSTSNRDWLVRLHLNVR